ncbi:hypothetical protein DSO57_1039707 [Entomophthora muscae]|uniref:Uncharacterized protein n=1 Tax=Entomophthora muscae TaxID=34485 RepID=A0ACC2U4S3_9FUNG|nr:hypothetical protein DSO57_1039707 [Entomophthora muscae]
MSGAAPMKHAASSSPSVAPVSSSSRPLVPSLQPGDDPLAKFLVAQQLPRFDEAGYRAWLYTFEDYADQLQLSGKARLAEVGRFLLGEARVWHQDAQVFSWEEWKRQAELRFAKYEPDAIHQLGPVCMVNFKSLREFLNMFQKLTNKTLKQHLKDTNPTNRELAVENFHSLISLHAFVNALTHSYSAMVQSAKLKTLDEAINLVCDKYDIYVNHVTDEQIKWASEWNPFVSKVKQDKLDAIVQKVEARLDDFARHFDTIFLVQEKKRQPQRNNPPHTYQRDRNRLYNPRCYNCSEVGHISRDCTAPCSICKEASHSNYTCKFNPINHGQKPQGLMMAEQNYDVKKCALSSSATPQPMKKSLLWST